MEENETDRTHIYDIVLKTVAKLPDEEKEMLMSQLTIKQLTNLLMSKDNMNAYIKSIIDTINGYNSLNSALIKVCNAMSDGIDGVNDIISDYEKLEPNKKKEAALKLLSNNEFQNDCCDILASELEKVVNTNSTAKAINDTFNILGWYKKLIKRNISTDNHPEV